MFSKAYVDNLLIAECRLHGVVTVVKCVLPRVEEENKTQLAGGVLLQGVFDSDEILQRLRHLAAGDG